MVATRSREDRLGGRVVETTYSVFVEMDLWEHVEDLSVVALLECVKSLAVVTSPHPRLRAVDELGRDDCLPDLEFCATIDGGTAEDTRFEGFEGSFCNADTSFDGGRVRVSASHNSTKVFEFIHELDGSSVNGELVWEIWWHLETCSLYFFGVGFRVGRILDGEWFTCCQCVAFVELTSATSGLCDTVALATVFEGVCRSFVGGVAVTADVALALFVPFDGCFFYFRWLAQNADREVVLTLEV